MDGALNGFILLYLGWDVDASSHPMFNQIDFSLWLRRAENEKTRIEQAFIGLFLNGYFIALQVPKLKLFGVRLSLKA